MIYSGVLNPQHSMTVLPHISSAVWTIYFLIGWFQLHYITHWALLFCFLFLTWWSCWQYYTHKQSIGYQTYCDTLGYLNMAFTVLFSIECVPKLLAFGIKVGSCLSMLLFSQISVSFAYYASSFPVVLICSLANTIHTSHQ